MDKTKIKGITKKIIGNLAIPAIVVIVVLLVCAFSGRSIFTTSSQVSTYFSTAGILFLTTIALSINLNSGRFDFSLGSMATLSAIISGKITYSMLQGSNLSAPVMMIISLLIGCCLGLFSGGLYCLLNLPPIIVSLGVTLIYEGIAYAITEGRYLNAVVQNASMSYFRENWWPVTLIILIIFVVIYLIFDRSKFGYNYRALKEGQKISRNVGIKEIPNALICYAISGALMGVVGFIQTYTTSNVSGGILNFASISIMFSAFLPMFIGGYIARYSNDKVGYLIAAFSLSLISSLFSVFYDVPNIDSIKSIIDALLLVVFLIYLNNEGRLKQLFMFRRRK